MTPSAADASKAREIAESLKLTASTNIYIPVGVDIEHATSRIAAALAAERAETMERCCKAVCEHCRDGYKAIETEPGQWAHLADFQPENLPKVYFDVDCYAAAIRAAR